MFEQTLDFHVMMKDVVHRTHIKSVAVRRVTVPRYESVLNVLNRRQELKSSTKSKPSTHVL